MEARSAHRWTTFGVGSWWILLLSAVVGVSANVEHASAQTTTWTQCATEGGFCSFTGTRHVRYGANTSWVERDIAAVNGGVACRNSVFGDPIYGVVKRCELRSTTGTVPTISSFTASPATIDAGGSAVLRWSATNATRYSIDNGIGVVTGTETTVRPTATTRYVLTASNANGSATRAVTVTVTTSTPTGGICPAPINPVDTSLVVARVGNGTPQSCTESLLRTEVAKGGTITFNCGASPATIRVTQTINVPTDRDTVIDGGNKITLDGNNAVRILNMTQANYRTNRRGLTIQRIALINGKAPASGYVAPNPNNPKCAYGYAQGSGAAIQVRDARLHVIDVEFRNNAAATPGPDVGGGAIYALGSLDVVVSGSRFLNNTGSNAGAIGLLQANGRIYNSRFENNSATGVGQNYVEGDECPGVGHPGQGGAGGNGGAVAIDGSDDTDQVVCGSQFISNRANELAGALFRTPNGTPRLTRLEKSLFDRNTAKQGGALFIINSRPLDIVGTTFTGNSAPSMGAGQLERNRLNIENSTFAGNLATNGIGGALKLGGSDAASVIRNVTFANNKAEGGPGLFSAAIFGELNFSVFNTVFANNTTRDAGSPMQCTFTPAPGEFDVQWPRNRIVGGAPDNECVNGIRFVDPRLGGIGANGGPTPTLLPQSGSPLIGAGRNCPSTDQRGRARNTATCTIGAVEP